MKTYLLALGICVVGCGSSETPADAGASQDSGTIDAGGPRCASTPTKLVDLNALADAGFATLANPFLAVNATDLYYNLDDPSGATSGSIMRVPLRGGAPSVVATTPHPVALTITPTSVVFVDSSGTLDSVPLAGGTPTKLASVNGQPAQVVQADDHNVYFADADGVKSVPLGGGAPKVLTSVPGLFHLVGQDIVVAEFESGNVVRVPTSGGATTTIATDQPSPLYPLPCGSDTCWLDNGSQGPQIDAGVPPSLERLGSGGTPSTIVQTGILAYPHGLSFDGSHFFTTNGFGIGILNRTPTDGGTPLSIVEMPGAGGVTTDDECVYWSNFLGIYSLSKSADGPFIQGAP